MKIGFSLSCCVQDIMYNKVPEHDVLLLISGTKIQSESDWDVVMDRYSETYWRKNPELGRTIASRLRSKMIQPRLYESENDSGVFFIGNGWWGEVDPQK